MLQDGRITRRGFLAGAAGLLGSMAAAEGMLARVAGAQAGKKSLVIGQSADVSKLDPQMSTTVNDIAITFNMFDNLLTRRLDGKLHPSLATEWKLVNPTTWQFKLRPNVKFHNGDPVTSADVKFTYERSYDPNAKVITKSVLNTIERVETPDPLTVVVVTKKPDPLLAARTAFYAGQIMPKAYYEKVGGDDGFNAKPVGSGHLKLNSWVRDDRLVLDVVKDYWGGAIDVDQVIFRPLPELAARVGALLKGEVDIITKVPPDQMDRIAKAPNTKIEGVLYGGLYCLSVVSQKPPLDNKLFRQAMSLALDRELIVKELWRGQAAVPNSLVVKGDAHWDASLPPLKYDPNQAKQLLKQVNYKGEELTLETPIGFMVMDKEMSEVVIAMWKDVGINAKLEQIEYSVYQQKIREKSFKGVRWTDPTSAYNDPDGMMWRHLAQGGPNAYWFRNARFDELGNAARYSVDEKFRAEAYKEMARLELEFLPLIPVIQPMELYGVQKSVDWKPYPNQSMEFRRFNLKVNRA
jgi:peptide/nickel transport system substrate-binding protein